jgi:hypothetical protein
MTRTPDKSASISLWKQIDSDLLTVFPDAAELVKSWLRLYIDESRGERSFGQRAEALLSRDLSALDKPPGRNSINSLIDSDNHRLQQGGLARLANALHLSESQRSKDPDITFREAAPRALEIGKWVATRVAKARHEQLEGARDQGAVDALSRIVRAHDHDPAMRSHFMHTDHTAQRSHFLVYRYSTVGDHVAKSILTVQAPPQPDGHWSFQNAFRGKPESDGIVRRAEGALIALGECYYCLGYTFRLPSEAASAETEIEDRDTRGLVVLAIEKDHLDNRPMEPISALVLSIANHNQPIIGRAALVHLCTDAGAGQGVDLNAIAPAVIPVSKVGADLFSVAVALDQAGYIRLGVHMLLLQQATERLRRARANKLAREIVERLDNMAAWEGRQDGADAAKRLNRGAIETFASQGRPRE